MRSWRGAARIGLAALILAMIGCRAKPDKPSDAKEKDEPLKVALLTPGPVSDDGWNASAYDGILSIQKELGAEIAHKESTNEGEFKQDFRDFARRGYGLVLAHGFEYSIHARDVADEFPDARFVTTGGLSENVRPNYSPIVFVIDDGMYLLGILAGKMTKTGKLGVVGGQEIPPVVAAFKAFEAGAQSVNPKAKVIYSYVGKWDDAAKAREQASAQIKEGVDFILQNADKAGLGVFQAVKEAREQKVDVYAFGSNRDQNHLEPSSILASAVSEIPKGFVYMANRVNDDTFAGEVHEFRLKDGFVSVVYNPQLESAIPADAKRAVQDARDAIVAGTLTVTGE